MFLKHFSSSQGYSWNTWTQPTEAEVAYESETSEISDCELMHDV